MGNERSAPGDTLSHLYQAILGETPDQESLQRMRLVRDAIGLRDNDALWSILAVLEYYLRLYEAIPDYIRDAGDSACQAWQKQATKANQQLAADEAELRRRCEATIRQMERLTIEHQAKHAIALDKLDEAGLERVVSRAIRSITVDVGNYMAGTLRTELNSHRSELETARQEFAQSTVRANTEIEFAARSVIGRLAWSARGLIVGLPAIVVATAAVMISVQWRMTDHVVNLAHDEITTLTQTKADLEQQVQDAKSAYAHFTARTDGTFFVSGKDGTFLVSPSGFGDVARCGSGLGRPCIQIQSPQ